MNFTNVKKVFYNEVFTNSYNVTVNGENMSIPLDTANRDYVELKKWIDDGGTVTDLDIGK
tara:strand:+ start:314 stop:493 length:180 start_codon:yes stop_codon:yes gene_type:complete